MPKYSKSTDLSAVKEITKALFDAVKLEPDAQFRFVAQHPFTNTTMTFICSGPDIKPVDLTKHDEFSQWRAEVFKAIDNCSTVSQIMCMMNQPWYLTWFKFVHDLLSSEDYGNALRECWTLEENPNQDCNVPLVEAIRFFRAADAQYLMKPEDLTIFRSIPDTIKLYRGVSEGREHSGLSYTANRDKAEWFANRFGEGYVIEKTVPKHAVLAYFNVRDEDEYVVNTLVI